MNREYRGRTILALGLAVDAVAIWRGFTEAFPGGDRSNAFVVGVILAGVVAVVSVGVLLRPSRRTLFLARGMTAWMVILLGIVTLLSMIAVSVGTGSGNAALLMLVVPCFALQWLMLVASTWIDGASRSDAVRGASAGFWVMWIVVLVSFVIAWFYTNFLVF